MSGPVSFGTLDERLREYEPGNALLMGSAGPVSDAFIMSRGTRDLLSGPVGSGKTTACVKRALVSAIRMPPLKGTNQRVYSLFTWRQTYAQLWGTTIKSWLKVLDPEKGVGSIKGSSPRSAVYSLDFEDQHGPIRLTNTFIAFGDDADPDDLGGTECTDAYLNEMNTLRKDLFINLARTVGRYPNRGELGLPDDPRVPYGRIFGDSNAPAPDNWTYDDFWGPEKPDGYRHFRQPGGFAPDAENLGAVGRAYYSAQATANAKRPWWIRIKLHHRPGYNRDVDTVYDKYDDDLNVSLIPLEVFPILPVLVGVDGGLTPAAAFMQELSDGQLRILDEVVLERGDEMDLARGMQVIMGKPRYAGCEFRVRCDPSMDAGADTTRGSMASRLGDALGLTVELAPTNDPETRHRPIREGIERGSRGLLVDATYCPVIRRALNGTYHYQRTHGSNDRSGVRKTPDSHVMEAAEYAASFAGTEAARIRRSERLRQREARRHGTGKKGAAPQRYNPLRRGHS